MSSPLVEAALLRDEQARASFASLQALAFISPDDLARELLALTRHGLAPTAPTSAPALNPNLNPPNPNRRVRRGPNSLGRVPSSPSPSPVPLPLPYPYTSPLP